MTPSEREDFDKARGMLLVEKDGQIEQLRLEIEQLRKTIEKLTLLIEVKN